MYEGSGEEAVNRIHVYLQEMAENIRHGRIALDKFVISKNLTKDPEQYADAKTQPHVTVALRMRLRGQRIRSGDTVPYVICCGESGTLTERAHHPDELRRSPELSADIEWYLGTQVHPPIARLCEHIEGTDAARIAMCLGLDAKRYRSNAEVREGAVRLSCGVTDEERFQDVERLRIACAGCKAVFEYRVEVAGCPQCQAAVSAMVLCYQVAGAIRRMLSEYHRFVMACDECRATSQRIRVYEGRCVSETCRGTMHPVISGQHVYAQLLYYRALFGSEAVGEGKQQLVEPVRQLIRQQLNQCAYPIISLRGIFSFAK